MTYVKKVKIFEGYDVEDLERKVNDFISREIECGFSIINVRYQTSATAASCYYSCMVYYSEPVEE